MNTVVSIYEIPVELQSSSQISYHSISFLKTKKLYVKCKGADFQF